MFKNSNHSHLTEKRSNMKVLIWDNTIFDKTNFCFKKTFHCQMMNKKNSTKHIQQNMFNKFNKPCSTNSTKHAPQVRQTHHLFFYYIMFSVKVCHKIKNNYLIPLSFLHLHLSYSSITN